jgi:regulator of sigma D
VWQKIQSLQKKTCKTITLALLDIFCESNVKNLSQNIFDCVYDKIHKNILVAQSTQNESVGCIAAQSIGEPATQVCIEFRICSTFISMIISID